MSLIDNTRGRATPEMPSRPTRMVSSHQPNTRTQGEAPEGMSPDGSYRTRLRYLRTRRAARLNAEETTVVDAGETSGAQAAASSATSRRRVRGNVKERLISRLRPILSSWFRPSRPYNQDECFSPYPKISFLVDRTEGLLCQVCRVSRFQMKGSEEDTLDDTTFSIMPCGHVLGSLCLKKWLARNDRCPICRFQLVYPVCGHRVPPRPITDEAVHMLPRTLPDEGSLPDLCSLCLKVKLKEAAQLSFDTAVHEFREARKRFAVTGNPLDEEALFRRKIEFETTIRDEFHIKYFSSWLSTW